MVWMMSLKCCGVLIFCCLYSPHQTHPPFQRHNHWLTLASFRPSKPAIKRNKKKLPRQWKPLPTLIKETEPLGEVRNHGLLACNACRRPWITSWLMGLRQRRWVDVCTSTRLGWNTILPRLSESLAPFLQQSEAAAQTRWFRQVELTNHFAFICDKHTHTHTHTNTHTRSVIHSITCRLLQYLNHKKKIYLDHKKKIHRQDVEVNPTSGGFQYIAKRYTSELGKKSSAMVRRSPNYSRYNEDETSLCYSS